eukprot:CAMPEP_0182522676 /NCGR_PEP_ID=MMETSP1323-20130603/477_1 /TAXON_ID=236787 /ORGANISM="Florenciella parvula, Strain RCC1693" /LENGTH=61 /DNA_ID=CAMNT_0024730865 /DNA_START=47 /DNA_END=229 /DNA_ORIENTATION=-
MKNMNTNPLIPLNHSATPATRTLLPPSLLTLVLPFALTLILTPPLTLGGGRCVGSSISLRG